MNEEEAKNVASSILIRCQICQNMQNTFVCHCGRDVCIGCLPKHQKGCLQSQKVQRLFSQLGA